MSDALKSLWQEQPLDLPTPPPQRRSPAQPDFAAPTSTFGTRSPRRLAVPMVIGSIAAAAVLLLVVSSLRNPGVEGISTEPGIMPFRTSRPSPPIDLLEGALAECRTFSSPEGSFDWDRASAACERALEQEPLHREAQELLARVGRLRVCEKDLKVAREFSASGRDELMVEALGRVTRSCDLYFLRALPLAVGAKDVKLRTGRECKAYVAAKQWEPALPRCELYARLACQVTGPLELREDPIYRAFLDARQKAQPGAPAWQCPLLEVFRPPPAPADPTVLARQALAQRFVQPEFAKALELYFVGRHGEARVVLQKVLENMKSAPMHATARVLLADIDGASANLARGLTMVSAGQLESAAEVFHEALELDARLMLGDVVLSVEDRRRALGKLTSYLRKTVVQAMSEASYERGRDLADRKDWRAACRVWKLGSTFSRESIDLLKALTNVCTKRASDQFNAAQTCEQLRAAGDFAVDGDGVGEQIASALIELRCK